MRTPDSACGASASTIARVAAAVPAPISRMRHARHGSRATMPDTASAIARCSARACMPSLYIASATCGAPCGNIRPAGDTRSSTCSPRQAALARK
ncbi:hypothetical protein BURPSS13_C0094 [Burkholderia pseudomallei S13]|nr:hypothetical protein BURPSS13_C0094 [Burkholderia pseudomallei S13]